jgi:hypothetical protein
MNSVQSGFLFGHPRLCSGIRRLDGNTMVVDSLLDTVELTLKSILRVIEGCHAIRFQRFKSAIEAMEFDAKLIAQTTDPLTHASILSTPAAMKAGAGWRQLPTAIHG